jgi:hypothetical protein
MALDEPEELPRVPEGVMLVDVEQTGEEDRLEPRGRVVWPPRLIRQTRGPVGALAGEELIAGLPTDPVRGAEPGEGDLPA